jgi:parvulin-like peptidyl-prolyl isomerase
MAEKTVPTKPEGQKTKAPRRGIHHPVTYVFTVAILVIIVVTFVFVGPGVGAGLLEGGGGRFVFGTYKGKPIEYIPGNFFAQQVENREENLRAEGSPADEAGMEERLRQIWREAFAVTAFHTAVVSIMQESGAGVSEKRIDEILVNHPRYMEDGEFSEKRYNQVSSSERLVIRGETRENILYYSYLQDMIGTQDIPGVRSSAAETGFLKSLGSPERNLRFVSFGFNEFPEDKITGYGRGNAEKFSQAKLSVITVISSRSDAEKIREQAAGGASFTELAVAQSKDTFAKSGGDMGWRYFYELAGFGRSDDDIRELFSLAPGDTSRVIEGPATEGQVQSYSIFRCDETVRLPDFTKPDTITAVRLYMNAFERGQIENYMVEQAKAFGTKARESSFLAATLSSAKQVKETGFFPINYGDSPFLKRVGQNNAELAAAAYREAFFSTAFSLKPDEVCEPVILQDAVIVMQLLEERLPAAEEMSILDFYLPNVIRSYQEESLQNFILNPANLKDNFEQTFRRIYNFSD